MITINEWFKKHAFFPLAAVSTFIFFLAAIVLLLSIKSVQQRQDTGLESLTSLTVLAINQKDRTLLDAIFNSSQTNLRARSLAICYKQSLITSIGNEVGPCTKSDSLLIRSKVSSVAGAEDTVLVAKFNRMDFGSTVIFGILLTFFIILIIFHILLKLRTRLFQDLIHPILKPNSSPSIDKIKELEDIRLTYEDLISTKTNYAVTEALLDKSKQIAHDIRSPLSAIQIAASLLADDEKATILRSASDRINKIAADLLGLETSAHLSQDLKTELQGQILSLLNEKRIEILMTAVDIEFNFSINSATAVVPVSFSSDLSRIFSNLINNSVEAIEMKGNIEVEVSLQKKKIVFSIKDNGQGIPENILNELGKKGFSYSPKRAHNGHGLGLWGAKCILRKWHGELSIQSQFGHGTHVEVFVPLPTAVSLQQDYGSVEA